MAEDSVITFKAEEDKKENTSSIKVSDMPGKITNSIGTGENAKNSFVYLVLKWSFIAGVALTVLLIINSWFLKRELEVSNIIEDIKALWGIITPIITLALGYTFGKSKE